MIITGALISGFVVFLIWLTIQALSSITKTKTTTITGADADTTSGVDETVGNEDAEFPSSNDVTQEEAALNNDEDSVKTFTDLGEATKEECSAVFTTDAFRTCKEKDKAGIGWNWLTTIDEANGLGWRCKNLNTDHYIVTFESNRFPGLVLEQKLPGTKISTGIEEIGKDMFDKVDGTFTVMPKKKDDSNVINVAQVHTIGTSSGSGSCGTAGIDPYGPKYWTHGENILSIKAKNKGPNDVYVKSQLKDSKGNWKTLIQHRTRMNASRTVWVPKGGRWCADTHNGTTRCRYWDEDGNGDSFLKYMQTSKNTECKDLKSYEGLDETLLRNQIQRLYFNNMKGVTGKQTDIGSGNCRR